MLAIDFDGKKIDIEAKIYKSLKLLTQAIISINFINIMEQKNKGSTIQISNDYTDSFDHDLIYDCFLSRQNELEEIKLSDDTLLEIIYSSQEDLSSCNFPTHEHYDTFEIARNIVYK
ncbi:hypothetical protein C1N63_21495 [Pantoea ananatis]|uniref:hypothetical protein n=1 Tax=Pantoea ananas TaxID=553 RepID=UPI000D72A02A|nr:hypothetical protein [Pantoea ananatis]AWQ21206.1 hypothetical protein C1N63_21495 [Pantoea ananatis]